MNPWQCAEVRTRLAAFLDDELPLAEQITVGAHLRDCLVCAVEAEDLERIGEALRTRDAGRRGARDILAGLRLRVVGQVLAERDQLLSHRVRRMLEDARLVSAALGGVAAALVCVVVTVGLLRLATPQVPLLGTLGGHAGAVPEGRIRPPHMSTEQLLAILGDAVPGDEDRLLALRGVVTRDGRLTEIEVLSTGGREGRGVGNLLRAASLARFEPARSGDSPVAVNLVWLVAHTTVKGKLRS